MNVYERRRNLIKKKINQFYSNGTLDETKPIISIMLFSTSELRPLSLSLSLSLWGFLLRGFVGSRVRMLSGVCTLTKMSFPLVTICGAL
jgi:hypothetical protein